MDALVFEGRQEINLVHVGGSHVQAGLLTDAIRYRMQSLAPGLAGGTRIFLSLHPGADQQPPELQSVDKPLGFMDGAALLCADP